MIWRKANDDELWQLSSTIPQQVLLQERWFAKVNNTGQLQLLDWLLFAADTAETWLGLALFATEALDLEEIYFIPLLITTKPRLNNPYFC